MNSPKGAVERQFRKTWVCFLIERFSGTRSHFLSSLDDDKAPVSCSPNGCTCMSTVILKSVGLSFIFISTLACQIKESICFLIEHFSGTRSHFLSSLDDGKAPVSCSPNGCTCMSTVILKSVGLLFICFLTLACEIMESICSKKALLLVTKNKCE